MKINKIGVIDSGIGGLVPLKRIDDLCDKTELIYLGDNVNVPYGDKSKRELVSLALKSIEYLSYFGVDVVVVGCNTLSTSVLWELKKYSPVPLLGVFPPINLDTKKTLLLATPKTVENCNYIKCVDKLALKFLAEEIERKAFNLNTVNLKEHLKSLGYKFGCYDRIILGCTHYELIKNKFSSHLCPPEIISGCKFCIERLKNNFNLKIGDKNNKNSLKFIGNSAFYNQKVYYQVVKKIII